jgi:hypothetical protein
MELSRLGGGILNFIYFIVASPALYKFIISPADSARL